MMDEVRGGGLGIASRDGSSRSSTDDTLLAEESRLKLEDADAMVESENLEDRTAVMLGNGKGKRSEIRWLSDAEREGEEKWMVGDDSGDFVGESECREAHSGVSIYGNHRGTG